MKRTMILVALGTILALNAAPALAVLYPTAPPIDFGTSTDGVSLQQILDGITVGPVAGTSSVDTETMALREDYDSYWRSAAGGSTAATILIEVASNADKNTLGIFDLRDTSKTFDIFGGPDGANLTGKAYLTFFDDGNILISFVDGSGSITTSPFGLKNLGQVEFGFYLDTPDGTWYSDTELNTDGFDHMLAYQGRGDTIDLPAPFATGVWSENHFVLAFEDRVNGGDEDWNDFVVLIESVEPVPVPAAVLLGMLGLSAAGLRLRKRA